MRIQYVFCLLSMVLISSCAEKKYKRTIRIAKCELYVETFSANSLGLNQEYLTDSTNFRMNVGTVDAEHDYYTYECKGDTLLIKKVMPTSKNCRWVILEDGMKTVLCDTEYVIRKPISLTQLKEMKKYE